MRIIALIIALAMPSWGQDNPVVGSYRDFSGGLNNDDASLSIAPNESPNLLNVNIDDPRGALTQRKGYQSCGTIPSGNTVTNLYEYAKNDGTRRLIVTDNTTVWQTANCIDFSTITTGLNSLELPRFATVLDDLWIVNGSTYPIVWNGSSATQLDGLNDRPEGPIGKYISYWKSRVWIANVPTSPSSVFFSALVDDSGNILDPETSTGAWLSTNQLYINRDDGSPIYGMRPYRDNLYIWKETGINRILFESEFDLSLAKNVSNTGSKFNESIVEMDDGLIRFLGEDGIYAFDGSRVHRLSSKISPTIESIKQQTGGQGFQLWDTAADFGAGTLVDVSSTAITDSILLDVNLSTAGYLDDFNDGDYTSNPTWVLSYHSGGTLSVGSRDLRLDVDLGKSDAALLTYDMANKPFNAYGKWSLDARLYYRSSVSYEFVRNNATYNAMRYHFTAAHREFPNETVDITFYVDNVSVVTYNVGAPNGTWHNYAVIRTPPNRFSFYHNDILLGTTDYIGVALTSSTHVGVRLYGNDGTQAHVDNVRIPACKSTGTFTSQISTFTGLTQWRTFAADTTPNGQTIAYYVRTGTTAYNTSLNAWSPISSGLIISTTTDGYAQWKAEFTTTDNSVTPFVNSVSMGYATGDTSATAVKGIQYKSRLWLAASTGTTNNFNDMVIVESKSPLNTYTLYDLPLSAMAIWSGNLYGAIGNTGKIARLDYGDTDDGAAISSFWDSRDEVFDNPIFYKTVNQVILDYSNDPDNTSVSVGLSPDQGSTYQTRSVNLGASSLPRNTAKLNYEPNTALGFRTRISNSTLGKGFKIYGIHPFGTLIPYLGN